MESFRIQERFILADPLNRCVHGAEAFEEKNRTMASDEVIVCMVLAFCHGNMIVTLTYKLTAAA
jgi:succinylglutamate desuccinylase